MLFDKLTQLYSVQSNGLNHDCSQLKPKLAVFAHYYLGQIPNAETRAPNIYFTIVLILIYTTFFTVMQITIVNFTLDNIYNREVSDMNTLADS